MNVLTISAELSDCATPAMRSSFDWPLNHSKLFAGWRAHSSVLLNQPIPEGDARRPLYVGHATRQLSAF
jgi:hypothetical protein